MTDVEQITGQVLDLARRALPGGEVEAAADSVHRALTRFANSFIHQNVTEDSVTVQLRAHVDGRTVTTTTTLTSPEGLTALVDRTVAAVRSAPRDPGWPGLSGPSPLVLPGQVDAATRDASPDDRAARVRAFVDAGQGLETAGYCQTGYWAGAYRNSNGQALHASATTADMDGIVRDRGADGVSRRSGRALSELDGAALGARAYAKATSQRDPIDLPPGHYEVVLEPEAVADLLTNFAYYGFNAKAHAERRSFAEPGTTQFDDQITLYDDPRRPFDVEGSPRSRLVLVDKGVTSALLHDRRTAAAAGAVSTGHGGDPSFGPMPDSFGFEPGDATVASMIAGVERGLLVSDFWYTRVLDPRQLALTGLTRNGVWLIEDGEVTRPVRNLRFTQAYPQALAPGRVLAVGAEAVPQPSRVFLGSWTAPALHLASWNITGGAAG
ncbi:peptidase U62 [Catellatospora sp. TT07R-123]|uniref:TldD/PmbA family protein n=1 Tax=Catellatospora sp. TT07R-123 TaxID=2733863 RepID=UPI001B092325|nr:metallopeptidase TldD-related protein [Catellatospora sp. TT07R-123]GHJ50235.1 peptidase U62 [Catellatospora sp. TT07R-123]